MKVELEVGGIGMRTFRNRFAGIFVLGLSVSCMAAPELPKGGALADFHAFTQFVEERYAYFDQKRTDWARTTVELRKRLAETSDRSTLMATLESGLAELYDSHAHLGSSSSNSSRLIPTDADVWAEWRNGQAFVVDVRMNSAAARGGLRPGARILEVNGVQIEAAAQRVHPRFLTSEDPEADSWALQMALAGRQNGEPVHLLLMEEGKRVTRSYFPEHANKLPLVDSRVLSGGFVWIRLNNSLGTAGTIDAFDTAIDQAMNAPGIVLDLRNTASGGTAFIAKGIIGRFVSEEVPYQRHEDISEFRKTGIRHRWVEWVSPRRPTFASPLVVLVGRWTGSMGEGLAIGLNGARHAPVLGTQMARLLGALDEIRLPASGIVVRIPVEKLFHVDGTPREDYQPEPVPLNSAQEEDLVLESARRRLEAIVNSSGPVLHPLP